jgi:tetratricopeptide (TPR) repeat protein
VFSALNRDEEAVVALQRAVELDAGLVWAHAELGETLRRLGRHEEALQALDEALKLEPNNAWALASKGASLHVLEHYEEALQALDLALKLEPNDLFAPGIKGYLLCDIGKFQDAVQVLDLALQLDLSSTWILALKGWALENLGMESAKEAQQAYEAALKGDPMDLEIHKGLANVLYLQHELEKARIEYRFVIEQIEKRSLKLDANTLSLLGWCYYRSGHYDEAEKFLVEALHLAPNEISLQFDLALTLLCNERYGLALREYQRGVELIERKPVQRRMGLLIVAIGDLREALIAQPNLEKFPEYQKALILLNTAQSQLKIPPSENPDHSHTD